MRDCPHCRHDFPTALDECPRCGTPASACVDSAENLTLTDRHHGAYVPIARFANVAEAGYFHSELEGLLGCELRLASQNHFDAPSASWWSNYVLSAPAATAEDAADLLKQLVADTGEETAEPDPDSRDQAGSRTNSLPAAESRIHWAPIILTLTAGTFVIWAAKQVHRHARGAVEDEPRQLEVWDHLATDGNPWVQHLENGRGSRMLMVDPVRRIATISEDRDGDGTFERRSRFSLTPSDR